MLSFEFDNAFVRELPADPEQGRYSRAVDGALYSRVLPEPVSAPHVLAWSQDIAERLGISALVMQDQRFARIFSGNEQLAGMQPFASNYGGHQFGHWAGQLGDGRAISLGEVVNEAGERWELQLKGAGRTPYSRHADGRAVLRSSLREFLCSEAMFHLGVPTTRALCLIATGDQVERDMFYDGHPRAEPGAIVCRVAPSFIRFGHFELPASRGDTELLKRLVDFTLRRDFPEIPGSGQQQIGLWFRTVAERTAELMAEWMRVGFVHGVMNTDNLSVLGLTIDYGPYGWIDNFDPDWTPNTTDRHGRRYRFGQQPQVAMWNLGRLATALSPLFDGPDLLNEGLQHFASHFKQQDRDNAARKLGLSRFDDADAELMRDWLALLHAAEIDMTLAFRALMAWRPEHTAEAFFSSQDWRSACYSESANSTNAAVLQDWLRRYAARVADDVNDGEARLRAMQSANPLVVPRNYLAQLAIDAAEQGDLQPLHDLMTALKSPYDDTPLTRRFADRRPEWARDRAGCSMLSCSS